ncbi:efflux RND transporter periplasmic adaptor subunit [Methylocapsa sp. D3K7]|uniref:efflux RND transporter periplasmic adaptor subunit n=1 Tax=Methylocapsa sp. D3K7 TaxID=3041435 RepID=UPI00244EB460|nr:efflux RND transporter periplasmic adaptor subunit [Methylocapsa sp. D3K7]WGJ13031.1 efflux RND transporter periplasmic adaptor subunit [Methylocapsa sp. D3K7]
MTMFLRSRIATLGLSALVVPTGLFLSAASQVFAASVPETKVSKGAAVSVTRAKKTCFDDTEEITGGLVPKAEVLVRPDREGYLISKVLVEAGAKVNAGQALAQLANPEVQQGSGDPVSVQAPVAGLVGKASAVVGTMASARAEPLFQIIAGGELELSAQITTKNLSKLSAGLPAKIKVVGVGELPGGRVRFVSNTVDPATQLGEVHVSTGHDERLKPGMFARATINLGRRCDRAAIPQSALLYGEDGTVVQVVRDERVESRIVTTGLQSDGKVEILQGIVEGDMVVARAGAFLRDGDRVIPVVVEDADIWK